LCPSDEQTGNYPGQEVRIWEVMVSGCAPQLGSGQITEYPTVALFEKHMNNEHHVRPNLPYDFNGLENRGSMGFLNIGASGSFPNARPFTSK
jgi:hypothetical protein